MVGCQEHQVTTLWFDTESFSECDLKSRGTHRYAAHPSTEITVAQWAIDDGEPVVEDLFGTRHPSRQLMDHLLNPDIEIEAHNSHFDRTLVRYVWGKDIPATRWRDTMVRSLAHGLPGALGKIGAVLGLADDQQKDKRGQQLIQTFCKPLAKNMTLRRATPQTHPAEWAEFLEYSRQDIVSMRAICTKLPKWNYGTGAEVRERELTLWHLDQKINDRGVLMDVALARAAVDACEIEKVRLKGEMRELTNDLVDGPSKRADILYFILAEYGVDLPDLKADTLRRRMEDPELPDGVKLLLSIRLEGTKTSTAKFKALLNAVSDDDRLRNTLQFAGASRTERWAGRIFQPQNMSRPDIELMAQYHGVAVKDLSEEHMASYLDDGITALKEGCAELFFNNVTGLASNTVRSCIIAPPGKKLVIADLANIEGRGLALLAREEWKLDAFRAYDAGTGPDLYILAYARAFSIDPKDVEKWMRQIGKVMELGLGYQGGVAAFLTFAAVYKMDLVAMADAVHRTASKQALAAAYGMWEWAVKKKRTLGLEKSIYVACEVLKSLWRAAHPATVQLWGDAQLAVQKAVLNPGVSFEIGQYMKAQRDGSWLRIRLPSGRCLCYLNPKIEGDQITYMGVNQYTKQWCRIKTYGGKIIENGTQAWARDVLAWHMPEIDNSGYEIVLTVHDELITETPDTPEYSHENLAYMMTDAIPWAPGAPLAAAGFETKRYYKG